MRIFCWRLWRRLLSRDLLGDQKQNEMGGDRERFGIGARKLL
jgi:hypothetical protein